MTTTTDTLTLQHTDADYSIGDRVSSLTTIGDDADAGVVLDARILDGEAEVLIGWDTGVRTWTPASAVRAEEPDPTWSLVGGSAVDSDGESVDGDYDLGSFADAAGVALDGYRSEAAARAAAVRVSKTPDPFGVRLVDIDIEIR